MKEFKIYTCGRMSGISYTEQMEWRNTIQRMIEFRTNRKVTFIHPPMFYGYHDNLHKSEREIRDWELKQICESDIVIVNLDGIMLSVGSHMELGAVCGANIAGNKQIMVVGFGKSDELLHPWIELGMLRYEEDMVDAVDYIAKYLLV
jgi:hypothetical protein